MSFDEPEDLKSSRSRRLNIYDMHGRQPHTGSNIHNSQIIIVEMFVSSLNLVPPPPLMYPEVEGTHHVNSADVPAYLLMDFVMQKGMNLSQAS